MKSWRVLSVVFPVVGLALGLLVGTAIQQGSKAKEVRVAEDRLQILEKEMDTLTGDVEFYKPFQAEAGALRLKLTQLQEKREELVEAHEQEVRLLKQDVERKAGQIESLAEKVRQLEAERAVLEEERTTRPTPASLPTAAPAPAPRRPPPGRTVGGVFQGQRVTEDTQQDMMDKTSTRYLTLEEAFEEEGRTQEGESERDTG